MSFTEKDEEVVKFIYRLHSKAPRMNRMEIIQHVRARFGQFAPSFQVQRYLNQTVRTRDYGNVTWSKMEPGRMGFVPIYIKPDELHEDDDGESEAGSELTLVGSGTRTNTSSAGDSETSVDEDMNYTSSGNMQSRVVGTRVVGTRRSRAPGSAAALGDKFFRVVVFQNTRV